MNLIEFHQLLNGLESFIVGISYHVDDGSNDGKEAMILAKFEKII